MNFELLECTEKIAVSFILSKPLTWHHLNFRPKRPDTFKISAIISCVGHNKKTFMFGFLQIMYTILILEFKQQASDTDGQISRDILTSCSNVSCLRTQNVSSSCDLWLWEAKFTFQTRSF